jgi:undecaprenyl-diphosphatase
MNDLQAAVLGFVQGATEFLPISSTAHLKIVPALFGWGDPGAAFTAIIQWGTLLAALIYFRKDIIQILGRPQGSHSEGVDRRLLAPIIIGTVPIVVCGLLFKKQIENELRSLYVIAGSMIVFALILAAVEAKHKAQRSIGSVTNGDGLLVGLGQMLALIPGASRSGTTITAALAIGLERSTAARFSFLLSLPSVFAAGVYELYKTRKELAAAHMMRPIAIATVVAFIVGWVSIDWLLKFLRRYPTYVFVIYRLVAGLAILAMLASGLLKP